jgi:hypothetical protein
LTLLTDAADSLRVQDASLQNFSACLPPSIERWVVAFRPELHADLLCELARVLPIQSIILLGSDSADAIYEQAKRNSADSACGFLEFDVALAQRYGPAEQMRALLEFAKWPASRVRFCFDVTDSNFSTLFSEEPRVVLNRGSEVVSLLQNANALTYRHADSELEIVRSGDPWEIHSGLELHDYILPSGEIECGVKSVDGKLVVDGWIVGTIPFGRKYGRIRPGDLTLTFQEGRVSDVQCNRAGLSQDLNLAFTADVGLMRVVELGFGLSKAIRRVADDVEVGCFWHERSYGLHLGLGAALREKPGSRTVHHHLDIVLRRGRILSDGFALSW